MRAAVVYALLFAAAVAAALSSPAWPDSFYTAPAGTVFCAPTAPCRLWAGSTTTNSSGAWSLTIPASIGFTAAPTASPMAYSADATLANQASVQMVAPTTSGAGPALTVTLSGTVTLPNTIAVGGAPNKAAGAGITVVVQAVGN